MTDDPDIRRPDLPQLIVSADPRCPGQYLKSYDPDAHDGQGVCQWTTDRAQAHVYPTFLAAFEAWRQVPGPGPNGPTAGRTGRSRRSW